MSTKIKTPDETQHPKLWRKRAVFQIGKSRYHRHVQYKQQLQTLALVLAGIIALGAVVIISNWNEAGGTQQVNCKNYPDYCVPFAGGATGEGSITKAETAETRKLYGENHGANGVVRGFTADNVPFIGNPNAPVHFRVVADFSCSHCNTYHQEDLARFIKDYVLTGQATLETIMTTGVGGPYSETATEAALCAAEQGAYWEMSDELFRLGRSKGVEMGYTLAEIKKSADKMGLDSDTLASCISSNRYSSIMESDQTFASDQGVTGTPTLLVRYGDSQEWQRIEQEARSYNNMKAITEGANTQGK